MSPIRIRPRSSIADAELARSAQVDLPVSRLPHRPATSRAFLAAVAAFRRRSRQPDRVIVMTMVPVPVRRSR